MKEAENSTKKPLDEAAAHFATVAAEVTVAGDAKNDADIFSNMIQTELGGGGSSATNSFVENVEVMTMVFDNGLSKFWEDAGGEGCKDVDYYDAIKESEKNSSSI